MVRPLPYCLDKVQFGILIAPLNMNKHNMEDLRNEIAEEVRLEVRREIAGLQKQIEQQTECYDAERRSSKQLSILCYIFLVMWLIACTAVIILLYLYGNPDNNVPVGSIMALKIGHDPPEGEIGNIELDKPLSGSYVVSLNKFSSIFQPSHLSRMGFV